MSKVHTGQVEPINPVPVPSGQVPLDQKDQLEVSPVPDVLQGGELEALEVAGRVHPRVAQLRQDIEAKVLEALFDASRL